MEEVSLELIIPGIIVVCIIFAVVGIFMGSRIGGGKKRIRELEGELKETKKDLDVYRSDVNDHFKKTSDLFSTMTENYKAVYLHLAEGAQGLCTSDAALLKGADSDFLKVTHEESGESDTSPETQDSGAEQAAEAPETISEQPESSEEESDIALEQEKKNLEDPESSAVDGDVEEVAVEEAMPAEDAEDKKDGLSEGQLS